MIDQITVAADTLRQAHSVVAMGHIGPDGDALGSMLALAAAARGAGKEAYATFGEPFVVGKQFGFLDTSVLVSPNDVPEEIDVVVVVDTGVPGRLGSALPIAERAFAGPLAGLALSGMFAFWPASFADTDPASLAFSAVA